MRATRAIFVLVAGITACARSSVPIGDDASTDAYAPAADAGLDSSSPPDMPPCTTVEERSPTGACDGMGRSACTEWATRLAAPLIGYAVCTWDTGSCARADACTSNTDATTCTCGSGPACVAPLVCAGLPATCVCPGA